MRKRLVDLNQSFIIGRSLTGNTVCHERSRDLAAIEVNKRIS